MSEVVQFPYRGVISVEQLIERLQNTPNKTGLAFAVIYEEDGVERYDTDWSLQIDRHRAAGILFDLANQILGSD